MSNLGAAAHLRRAASQLPVSWYFDRTVGDLERRLMRYPCSYMIYSPAFEALRADAKKTIYERMREVMASRFSAEDRQAVATGAGGTCG